MIVVSPIGDRYPDDADPSLTYRLPVGLRPIDGSDGVPQVSVTRSPDGGVLHLRLGLVWPAFSENEQPAPIHDGRFRLTVHGPSSNDAGEWRPAVVNGSAVIERSISLTPKEIAIARHLGKRTGDLVDVEFEAAIRGRGLSAPWLVSTTLVTLKPRVSALLGLEPLPWERIEAVVMGLAEDTFTWHPLVPGALRLPRDTGLRAIASLMASSVFTRTEGGWVINDEAPEHVQIRLDTPRAETMMTGLRWSLTEFLEAQANPDRHLIDVTIPAPFAAAEISVFNDVPLAEGGVRSIAIEFRTGGPTGRVRHEFLPEQPSAVRLRFVRETVDELKLEWSAKLTIVTAQGPAIHTVEPRPAGLLLDLDAAAVGVVPLRCSVQTDVFAHLASVEVTIGARVLTLTRTAPVAWAVGRQPPESATVTAVLTSGERVALGTVAIEAGGVHLTTAMLGIGSVTEVSIRCADTARASLGYLAVEVEGHGWRTLEASQTLLIPVRRDHRFAAPRIRYRTRHVGRDGSGATSVIAESGWRNHAGDVLDLSV